MGPWGESIEDEFAEEEFSELVDADLPRADLVGKGANGVPFLVAKSADGAGMVPAALVRKLMEGGTMNVRKAKSDPIAVYDASGRLVGTVDQAAITVLSDGSSLVPTTTDKPRPQLGAAPVADEAELQPTPSDAVGVPADRQRAPIAKSDALAAQRDSARTIGEREAAERQMGARAAAQLGTMLKARRGLEQYKAATVRRAPR